MYVLGKIYLSCLIGILILSCFAGQAKAETDISVTLSAKSIVPGETLFVEIQVNTSNPWEIRSVNIIISHVETGEVVVMASVNLTHFGEANYSYTPSRPAIFGDYFVWIRAANQSAFSSFTLQPSVLDLWEQMKASESDNAKLKQTANYAILLTLTLVPVGVVLATLISYLYWRLPDPEKNYVRDWLLSKLQVGKLGRLARRLTKDFRDLDRKGYVRRRVPIVIHAESQNSALSKDRDILNNLADSIHSKMDFLKKRVATGEEFEKDLRETATELDKKIVANNQNIENELKAIQIRSLEANRVKIRDPKRMRREMEAARLTARLKEQRGD
jgi:hypothetical protein